MQIPFLNIHTHHDKEGENSIQIKSLFLDQINEKSLSSSSSYYSLGIHPWNYTSEKHAREIIEKRFNLFLFDNVIAVGETGLDKFIEMSVNDQEKIFQLHADISEKLEKPMIIHCVKSYDLILNLRKSFNFKQYWIIHGFNSSMQMADQLTRKGCIVSFGELLFKDTSKAYRCFDELSNSLFFLETDDSNHDISEIYAKAAEIKGVNVLDVKEQVMNNFRLIFNRTL